MSFKLPLSDVRGATTHGNTVVPCFTQKYNDVPTTAFDSEDDWLVLRYPDVLLLYAEAAFATRIDAHNLLFPLPLQKI